MHSHPQTISRLGPHISSCKPPITLSFMYIHMLSFELLSQKYLIIPHWCLEWKLYGTEHTRQHPIYTYGNEVVSVLESKLLSQPKMSGQAHLVFIPLPVMSHLAAAVNVASLITARDDRVSVTVLVLDVQADTKISSFIQNSSSRINFLHLPPLDSSALGSPSKPFFLRLVELQKIHVRDALAKIIASDSGRLAGVVLDMFCGAMVDVAEDLRLPTYLCCTTSAATLGLIFHLQDGGLKRLGLTEADKSSPRTVAIPTFSHPVPVSVLPERLFHEDGDKFVDLIGKFKKARGIIVNTFFELETHAISSLAGDGKLPPVYPIGPILQSRVDDKDDETIRWLEEQPDSSVVFLCFGTNGWFDEIDQVREIARALENSDHRFLWSLRKPPAIEKFEFAREYEDFGQILPDGFLERTASVGRVIGWAPQVAVLSHRAVGGFVSHCGWNSVLESVWCGVPVAAFPLAAEQQANAFQMVNEFGTAVEVKLDYRRGGGVTVLAAVEIEAAVRRLMAQADGRRDKVRELKEKSRTAVMEGGSSWDNLSRWIDSVIHDI